MTHKASASIRLLPLLSLRMSVLKKKASLSTKIWIKCRAAAWTLFVMTKREDHGHLPSEASNRRLEIPHSRHTLMFSMTLNPSVMIHKSQIMWVWSNIRKLSKITDMIWNWSLASKPKGQIVSLIELLIREVLSLRSSARPTASWTKVPAMGLVIKGKSFQLWCTKRDPKMVLITKAAWSHFQITRSNSISVALRTQSMSKITWNSGTRSSTFNLSLRHRQPWQQLQQRRSQPITTTTTSTHVAQLSRLIKITLERRWRPAWNLLESVNQKGLRPAPNTRVGSLPCTQPYNLDVLVVRCLDPS